MQARRERTSPSLETPRWTEVPRGAGAGLRPSRFMVAWMAAVVVCVLTRVPLPWLEGSPSLAELWVWSPLDATPVGLSSTIGRLLWAAPWTTVFMGLLVLVPIVFAMVAIGRSVVVERVTGRAMSMVESVSFAGSRAGSMAVAYLLPIGLIGVFLVALAALGAGLLRIAGVNVAGAMVYAVAVVVAVPVALLIAVLFVGWPMIPGALAAEGTGSGKHGRGDGIDALSRVIAYVLNAPLWTGLYGAIGLALVWGMAWVSREIATLAVGMTRIAMTWWLPDATAAGLAPGGASGGSEGAARAIMAWADLVPGTFAAGAVLATASGAAMMVYLMVRYRCDGQHPQDIWLPGSGVAVSAAEPAGGSAGASAERGAGGDEDA